MIFLKKNSLRGNDIDCWLWVSVEFDHFRKRIFCELFCHLIWKFEWQKKLISKVNQCTKTFFGWLINFLLQYETNTSRRDKFFKNFFNKGFSIDDVTPFYQFFDKPSFILRSKFWIFIQMVKIRHRQSNLLQLRNEDQQYYATNRVMSAVYAANKMLISFNQECLIDGTVSENKYWP